MNSRTNKEDSLKGENLTEKQLEKESKKLSEWEIIHQDSMQKLRREYSFLNFNQVLEFTKRIKGIAEQEQHHPVISSTWGRVTILWWTHTSKGIQLHDFQMAALCDQIYKEYLGELNEEA